MMKYQLKDIWIVWDLHNDKDIGKRGIKQLLITRTKLLIGRFKNSQIYIQKEKKNDNSNNKF